MTMEKDRAMERVSWRYGGVYSPEEGATSPHASDYIDEV